jgi:hypothetical protein
MDKNLSELSTIAFKNGSNKCPQYGRYSFTEYYFKVFEEKRKAVKKILEIGVRDGADLRMWRDFFPNAQVYGTDTSPSVLFNDKRIKTYLCDPTKSEDLKKLIEKIGSDIDIIIDDGSHLPVDQIDTCVKLMPLVDMKVTYIIEAVSDTTIRTKLTRYDNQIPNIGNTIRTPDNTLVVVKYRKDEKVSIIIPTRSENFEVAPGVTVLQRTVQDIYEKATGNFEVLVGFDGPPYQEFPDYPNLTVVKLPRSIGLKIGINMLSSMATGKYIYKTDAHCMFGPGFDEILQAYMEDTWVVTPRFYVLDAMKWQWQDERHYDYFYLSCPFTDPRGVRFKAGGHWPERTAERENDPQYDIDETPQMHGSGWFVDRNHFLNKMGGFMNVDPFGHAQEPPYLGLKSWLSPWGGKLMVNKKTWYAHMHQDATSRGYIMSRDQTSLSYKIAVDYWMGNKWEERIHDFDWFVKKFLPMPTWPDNWEDLYTNWKEHMQ